MNTSWHNYPSIFALGHRWVTELLQDEVLVEEKIDGSQFSFGSFEEEWGDIHASGKCIKLRCKSKGKEIDIENPEKMFAVPVKWCIDNWDKMQLGWTYRCEFLSKPQHNTLAYDRVPRNNLILFDIATDEEVYLDYDAKDLGAAFLGLETVPVLYKGKIESALDIKNFLQETSILGGCQIEGVVIKNYNKFGPDKKVLMGKYVSEAFKEIHGAAWRKSNPTSGDIIQEIAAKYNTSARWQKAVQHLRESGDLTDSPKDIEMLMKEVPADIMKECLPEIIDTLLAWALPKVKRTFGRGLPQWYKEQLLNQQFNGDDLNPNFEEIVKETSKRSEELHEGLDGKEQIALTNEADQAWAKGRRELMALGEEVKPVAE